MPQINLYEKDLTIAGGLNASNNIVYVPGFAKYVKEKYRRSNSKDYITWPHLFTSISEFKEVFAKDDVSGFEYAIVYDKDNNYYTQEEIDGIGYKLINAEKSMQYALALLSVGLPVLYDLIECTEESAMKEDEYMDKLSGFLPSRLALLEDRNNYDIKFITSGGYYLPGIDLMPAGL